MEKDQQNKKQNKTLSRQDSLYSGIFNKRRSSRLTITLISILNSQNKQEKQVPNQHLPWKDMRITSEDYVLFASRNRRKASSWISINNNLLSKYKKYVNLNLKNKCSFLLQTQASKHQCLTLMKPQSIPPLKNVKTTISPQTYT